MVNKTTECNLDSMLQDCYSHADGPHLFPCYMLFTCRPRMRLIGHTIELQSPGCFWVGCGSLDIITIVYTLRGSFRFFCTCSEVHPLTLNVTLTSRIAKHIWFCSQSLICYFHTLCRQTFSFYNVGT